MSTLHFVFVLLVITNKHVFVGTLFAKWWKMNDPNKKVFIYLYIVYVLKLQYALSGQEAGKLSRCHVCSWMWPKSCIQLVNFIASRSINIKLVLPALPISFTWITTTVLLMHDARHLVGTHRHTHLVKRQSRICAC